MVIHRLFSIALGLLGMMATDAVAENTFTFGGEGFRDTYNEHALMNTHTNYGSATAGYEHSSHGYFSAVDGRYSWGDANYKSAETGYIRNTTEIESDLRLRTGMQFTMWHGIVMPYIGVGWRYYFDKGKGLVTSTNHLGYDRHISQLYAPIGVTYRYTAGNWIFAPTAEFDPLLRGRVSSHLKAVGGTEDVINFQKMGFGLRAEFMVGQQYKKVGWQAGPFVRYWHIHDSTCVITADSNPGECWVEPENTRLQAGAALRVNF